MTADEIKNTPEWQRLSRAKDVVDDEASQAAHAAIRGLKGLSKQDREWIEREATKLMKKWKWKMDAGIHMDAIPAVWLYAQTYIQKCHETQPIVHAELWPFPFKFGSDEIED